MPKSHKLGKTTILSYAANPVVYSRQCLSDMLPHDTYGHITTLLMGLWNGVGSVEAVCDGSGADIVPPSVAVAVVVCRSPVSGQFWCHTCVGRWIDRLYTYVLKLD